MRRKRKTESFTYWLSLEDKRKLAELANAHRRAFADMLRILVEDAHELAFPEQYPGGSHEELEGGLT